MVSSVNDMDNFESRKQMCAASAFAGKFLLLLIVGGLQILSISTQKTDSIRLLMVFHDTNQTKETRGMFQSGTV